jgi:hypothetical protein
MSFTAQIACNVVIYYVTISTVYHIKSDCFCGDLKKSLHEIIPFGYIYSYSLACFGTIPCIHSFKLKICQMGRQKYELI